LVLVLSDGGVGRGAGGDAALLGIAVQCVIFPAFSGVALIAATFTAEKENGTLVPLLAAPIRDLDIVVGKLGGMVITVMAASLVTLGAGHVIAAYRSGLARAAEVFTPELPHALPLHAFL